MIRVSSDPFQDLDKPGSLLLGLGQVSNWEDFMREITPRLLRSNKYSLDALASLLVTAPLPGEDSLVLRFRKRSTCCSKSRVSSILIREIPSLAIQKFSVVGYL